MTEKKPIDQIKKEDEEKEIKNKNEIKENNSNKFQETKLMEKNEINMDLKSKSILNNNNILNNNKTNYNTKSSLQIIKDINNDMDLISKNFKSNPLINLNLINNDLKNTIIYDPFNTNNNYSQNEYNYNNNNKNNENQISKEEIQNIINKANEYINKNIESKKTYNIIIVPNNSYKKYENKFCQSDEHYSNDYIKNYNNNNQNFDNSKSNGIKNYNNNQNFDNYKSNGIKNYNNNQKFDKSKSNGIKNFKRKYSRNIDNCYKNTNSKIGCSFTIDTNITNSKIKMIDDLYDFTSNPKKKPMVYRQPESKNQYNYKFNRKSSDARYLYNNRYNKYNNMNNLDNGPFQKIDLKGINKAIDVLMEKIKI